MSIKLTIPEACHEDWQKMQPDKDGRHCLSCRKTVVDFSLMSDKEILDYISHAGDNLCGRFDPHQLDRGLRENSVRKRFSWAYAWALAAVGFFTIGKARAQGGIKIEKVTKAPDESLLRVGTFATVVEDKIQAKVVDENTGQPVPFASVISKKGKTAIADAAGLFWLEQFKGANRVITISAIGYASQTIHVNEKGGTITIYLKPEAQELEAVEVKGFTVGKLKSVTCELGRTMGIMIMKEDIGQREQFTRVFKDWLPKKDIVSYPNPVAPGNTMKVDLKLKETGQFRIELIDAGGQIIWIRSMNIPSRQFNISIPTQATWSAGVYWLRVSGNHTKNVYNSRVVVQ